MAFQYYNFHLTNTIARTDTLLSVITENVNMSETTATITMDEISPLVKDEYVYLVEALAGKIDISGMNATTQAAKGLMLYDYLLEVEDSNKLKAPCTRRTKPACTVSFTSTHRNISV